VLAESYHNFYLRPMMLNHNPTEGCLGWLSWNFDTKWETDYGISLYQAT